MTVLDPSLVKVEDAVTGITDSVSFFQKLFAGFEEPTFPFGLFAGEISSSDEGSLELEAELVRRLRDHPRNHDVSVESLCHLAWALVLARVSGHDDVAFGTVFGNILPFRIKLGDKSIKALARSTHELLAEVQNHGQASLTAFFDASVSMPLYTAAICCHKATDRVVSSIVADRGCNEAQTLETYPLSLVVGDWGERLELKARAQKQVGAGRICEFMKAALEQLVSTLETETDAMALAIDVMPAAERQKVLYDWNATEAYYPHNKCIHDLFEAQAAKTPEAIAVTHEDRQLTYAELNAKANRLAHYLRGLGVKPDARVAICVERSLDMLVGLLAILKAGGAYVPLDPAYPADRLAFMLKDCTPVALLTQNSIKPLLAECAGSIPMLDLEFDAPAWSSQSDANPDRLALRLQPDHLAYIIYTSGSTGTPKGVLIEHANVTRLFTATDDWFGFDADDVWSLFHSFAFDFSVWEIWGALLYGGRLVIVPSETARSPEDFYKLICESGVTVLNQTPSAFRGLIRAQAASKEAHKLRYVIFGGEALEVTSLKPWYANNPDQSPQLINMYGITETAVHVTYRPLFAADTTRVGASPVGCRIPDLKVYILDENLKPVPIGVTGEIYVGGAGVARGYLNRPDLTAERFLPNPFAQEQNTRMYKTGDLGRWRPDGTIDYLGRNDFQLKIRGFRIELGEIEARLKEYEGVVEAVVIAREDSAGDKGLAAYYVARAKIRPEALRAYLVAKLPEYMVPAAYVRVDRMPLSHNGKLDRTALPAPNSGAYVQGSYEAPIGPVEEKLAQIWAGVLGLGRISRNANFFDLGGHSLLAIRMLALLEAELGHSLSLTSLFGAPSIATFGQLLQQGRRSGSPYVAAVQPEGTKPPLFAINTPSKYYDISKRLGKNQPLIGLQLFHPAKQPEFRHFCLEDVAGEYVKLIREIQPQGPYAIMGWCVGGVLAFETAWQLIQMGHEVSFLGLIDSTAPDYVRRRGAVWMKAAKFVSRWNRNYAEMRAGRQKLLEFARQTDLKKPFTRSRRALPPSTLPVSPDPELQTIERNNNEMLAYLWKLQGSYEPKLFPGRLHVFISQFEAAGWLVDSSLGWARLAREGTETVTVSGDHSTIFNEPGAGQMAAAIGAALEAPAARDPSKASFRPATVRANGKVRRAENTKEPLVSVIIPAYNAERNIAQAIGSATAQTYPEIEIIVVDDGSKDRTVQTARETLKSTFDGRWSVLEFAGNRGASAARNAGVRQTKGEWIQFIDSDDTIAADKIELQMKHARTADPDVPAIYSSWRHVYLEDGKFVPAGPLNTPRYEGKHPLMFCMYYSTLHHGACLLRRTALERVHGFNETLGSYEDADLLVRLAKEIGPFQFAALNGPSYLWRLYKEQLREGGEEARYKLQDTAINWIRLVKRAAGNRQIGDILTSPGDMIVWRQHCTSYARRLHESGAGTFKLFMEELGTADPGFTYP